MAIIKATKTELHKRESEIAEVEGRMYEDHYYIGIRLAEIKQHRLYEAEGFKTWDAYCKSERLSVRKTQANELIRTSEIRPVLDEIPSNGKTTGAPVVWSHRTVCELAKLDEKSDVKRVSKKIATKLKKEPDTKLTPKLVKQVVEEDIGITRKKAEKSERNRREKEGRVEKESQLVNRLKEFLSISGRYRKTFEAVTDVNDWEDADRESRGIAKRLADELETIASFLRS